MAERKIVKARAARVPGRVVRIDLGDRRGFGRRLTGVTVEFYERMGAPGEQVDLVELVASPVAFTINVMDSAFRRGGWELLDVVTLTPAEESRIHRYRKRDPINGRLSIYWSNPADGTFGERPATAGECADLENVAVWSREHVEDRLQDFFDGRSNKWVESLR